MESFHSVTSYYVKLVWNTSKDTITEIVTSDRLGDYLIKATSTGWYVASVTVCSTRLHFKG